MPITNLQPQSPRRTHPVRLTYEVGLWLVVAGLAVSMRLLSLGGAPLTNAEAANALRAMALARGQSAILSDPLFDTLQAIIFASAGPDDAAARLIPALVGAGLCLLPLALRRSLGQSRALIFGGLLAVSPTLWHLSRQSDGALMAWALAFGGWCAWRAGRATTCWLLAGLLAATGCDAVAPALALLAATALDRETWRQVRPARVDWATAVIAFVAGSTLFGLRLNGISDAFNGYATGFAALTSAGQLSIARGLIGFLLYEPINVLGALGALAILGLNQVLKRDLVACPWFKPWLVWIGAGLLLFALAQSRQVSGLVPWVVGSAALASILGDALARSAVAPTRTPAFLPIVAISFVMLVYGYLGLNLYAGQGQNLWMLTAVIALLMLAGVIVVSTLTFSPVVALSGVSLAIAGGLLLHTLSAGIQLTLTLPGNPAEPYVVEAAPRDVRELTRAAETIGGRAFGDPHSLPVQLPESAPDSLTWALLKQRQLTTGGNPGATGVAVLPLMDKPDPDQPFVGNRFTIATTARIESARCDSREGQLDCTPLARWLVFRQLDDVQRTDWVLWLRQDVALKASGE